MAYRIEYDHAVRKYEIRSVHANIFPLLFVIGVLTWGWYVYDCGIFPSLGTMLIPGDDALTVHAFQCMTDDLRSGAGLYDAIFDFCSMVIHGR